MATIRPFRGIRYDLRKVGPAAQVVAPPDDVIGAEEQARLYDASPWNVIRVDLNREADRYAASAQVWARWLDEGALVRDAEPALYAYAQRFALRDGTTRERYGFF